MSTPRRVMTQLTSSAAHILALLAIGLAAAVISAWIAASYFQIDVVGSLIWPGSDGYCVEGKESLGVHCFSDVAQFLLLGETMDPEGSNPFIRNYPPINRTIFWIFQMLGVSIGYRLALVSFVVLLVVCMLIPSVWASRNRPWVERSLIIALAGVATFPFLAAVDRGNNIALAIPFVLMVVVGLQRNRDVLAISGIVIASQIKPQFGLLVVAFLVLRKYRAAIVAVVVSIAVFLGSFVLVLLSRPALDPVSEFKDFILFTRFYDQYIPLDGAYPVNTSFAHLIAMGWNAAFAHELNETMLQLTMAALVGILIVVILWRGSRLPIAAWFAAILMAVSLTPAITFAYYLGGALVIVAMFFRAPFDGGIDQLPRFLRLLLMAAVVSSLTPLLIPGPYVSAPVEAIGSGVVVSILPRIATVLWFAFLVAVAVEALRRGRDNTNSTDLEPSPTLH